MATRRIVPNKGIDGGRIHVPYANGARFFAPLTDSVVPNRSIGPITFSRATRGLYGSIRNLQIWDYEISDSEATALTTI